MKILKSLLKRIFPKWKINLYIKYKNIIDLFIKNYDEEKIIATLQDLIKGSCYNKYNYLDNYYNLIYTLLSLNDQYRVIIKNNFNEKDNIRELLYVNKIYFDVFNDNSNDNYKNNNNKNNILNENSSKIFYITIKNVFKNYEIEKGCIEALDDNEDFIFNGIKLKNIYNKIIKYGIGIFEEKFNVIYDINYGNNFKRKEMPKEIYSGEIFERFNTNKFYFIDKTRMISKIIGKYDAVYLITRPRRFGKSLNLRMIQEFFKKPDNEDDNRFNLFDGLEVSRNRINMREFHKYPVIYLNFKSDESINYDEAIAFLKTQISEVFEYYKEKINFKELNINEQTEWNKIENKEVDKLYNSIIFLMKILKRFYKRRCIVLIDEYDKILINGIEFKYYDKINRDIKSFISNTFKGNPYIYFGVLTGCLDIGLKGVFSGANNFYKCSMLFDTCFSDCYGFTNAELNDIFKHFDVSEVDKKQIKKQYNGYSCGSDE
eukprot:jgi/Orpsp1_1/1176554/evm.model.c7180000058069.1